MPVLPVPQTAEIITIVHKCIAKMEKALNLYSIFRETIFT